MPRRTTHGASYERYMDKYEGMTEEEIEKDIKSTKICDVGSLRYSISPILNCIKPRAAKRSLENKAEVAE